MKLRTDFVTNSSSCAFFVMLDKEKVENSTFNIIEQIILDVIQKHHKYNSRGQIRWIGGEIDYGIIAEMRDCGYFEEIEEKFLKEYKSNPKTFIAALEDCASEDIVEYLDDPEIYKDELDGFSQN